MRILIADDDRISRETHKQLLSLSGDVDTVVNGAEAVQKFKQALISGEPYSLICLDISMPFFDGRYALDEIRKIERAMQLPKSEEVRVVMITSSRERNDILYVKGKCDAYLLKPLTMNAIDNLLANFRIHCTSI